MKPRYAFIFVLNLIVSIGLAFAVVVLFSKEQQKERDIQALLDQQRSDQQKLVKAREEEDTQKEFEAQRKQESQKQLEARKIRDINDALDKIDARLKKVLDEPSGYADETKAQRDTQEELLRQLAHCARTEIGLMVTEMQDAGFTNNTVLQENLDTFFQSYENKIHDEHISYDYIDLGLQNGDHKRELDEESAQLVQVAFNAKRAIHNLRQNPK